MEIIHGFHKHGLTFCEDLEDDVKKARDLFLQLHKDDGESVCSAFVGICAICDLAVSGCGYSCIECNYYIHKSCGAEIPDHMERVMHQKHPLYFIPYSDVDGSTCDACHRPLKTFTYQCHTCKFTIDHRCASLPLSIKHESHEHPFKLLPKSASFCCDACGTNCDGISYMCTTCFLWVHPECAVLPRFIKNGNHPHLLYLNHSHPLSIPILTACYICSKEMNPDCWSYSCSDCSKIAHVACATLTREPIRDITIVTENKELTTLKAIRSGQETVALEVGYHCHGQHRLNLCDVLPKDEKFDGCTRPILAAPYYSCHQCKYFLHISCAELPIELQHPLHPEHSLTLLPKSPCLNGIFRCQACTNLCNGFTYSCEECEFNLDVSCSSLEVTLKHDGHEHLLALGQETSCEQCSACGDDCVGFTYGCGDCNFKLDTNCATLPHTAKHVRHRHTFSLAFASIEDGSNEYYCDMCENPRNPNHWFYYCADCELSAHLGCMRGEYPYIKFGGTYKHDSHPHLLTFVQTTKGKSTCNTCNHPCESLAYECVECNFNIHWMCQNTRKGTLTKDHEPDPRPMYLLDKAVYMMTDDAKEICLKEKRSTNLKHFTHDHFLALGYVQNKIKTCFACKLYLAGPCYYCQKCRMYLHRKCAEAPPVLKYRYSFELSVLNSASSNGLENNFIAGCVTKLVRIMATGTRAAITNAIFSVLKLNCWAFRLVEEKIWHVKIKTTLP